MVEEKDSTGAHDFYSKKTKAEIAFLKRKEKVVRKEMVERDKKGEGKM